MKYKYFCLVVILLITSVLIVGCVTSVDPATGVTYQQIDPCYVKQVDKYIVLAESVAETSRPFIPIQFHWLFEVFGAAVIAWQQFSKIKIIKGAKAAKRVISGYVKPDDVKWTEARKILLDAESKGAKMPDKL